VGGGETGRSGPDDGYFLAVRVRHIESLEDAGEGRQFFRVAAITATGVPQHALDQFDGAEGFARERLGAESIGDKTFESADGDRLVDVAATAGGLARRATNSAADGRQRIGAAGDQVGGFKVAPRDGPHISTSIRVYRTGVLAVDLALPVIIVGNLNRNGVHP